MTDCHCNDPAWEGDVCPADGRQLVNDTPLAELCGGCLAEPGEECGPDCLSHVTEHNPIEAEAIRKATA